MEARSPPGRLPLLLLVVPVQVRGDEDEPRRARLQRADVDGLGAARGVPALRGTAGGRAADALRRDSGAGVKPLSFSESRELLRDWYASHQTRMIQHPQYPGTTIEVCSI